MFLGVENYRKKNWEGLLEKVSVKLSKWKWLLPELSYRGRVLVTNNLAASTLWHRLNVLEPPDDIVKSIQRKLVEFFWSGQHWIPVSALYLPTQEGGQGLIDIRSRIGTFRLQAAQRLLYEEDVGWTDVACALLRRTSNLGDDKQLFLLKVNELDFNHLTSFYQSMLKVWNRTFSVTREILRPQDWIMGEPLFHNSLIQTNILSSSSVRNCLIRAGCTKIEHLRDDNGWRTAVSIQHKTGIRSLRLLDQMLDEVRSALPGACREALRASTQGWSCSFAAIRVSAAQERPDDEDSFVSFKTPELRLFQDISKKALYTVCVKVSHQRVKTWRWTEVFGPGFRGCWRSLYKPPIEKRTADFQWRLMYGIIAANRHVAHLNPEVGRECPFYGTEETVDHLFIQCERLRDLFNFLEVCFESMGEEFSYQVFISGPKYRVSDRRKVVLLNYLVGTAKMAIWKTRKNWLG